MLLHNLTGLVRPWHGLNPTTEISLPALAAAAAVAAPTLPHALAALGMRAAARTSGGHGVMDDDSDVDSLLRNDGDNVLHDMLGVDVLGVDDAESGASVVARSWCACCGVELQYKHARTHTRARTTLFRVVKKKGAVSRWRSTNKSSAQ